MLLRINGVPISADFGAIDSVHKVPHTGVDIPLPVGTPLHSVSDGIVTKVSEDSTQRIEMVRVEAPDGTDVLYGHLSQPLVNVGDHVKVGDVIALSGNTGHSTGPHVHLQMISNGGVNIDPSDYASLIVEPAPSIMDRINGIADWLIGKEAEFFVKPATHTMTDMLGGVVNAINVFSAEIITLGIVVCAVGMMVGPIIGGGSKWIGRLFITFWGGVIWRILT